jgi:enamine deaminase RidA (YjgF/YER057c/UK114 family)
MTLSDSAVKATRFRRPIPFSTILGPEHMPSIDSQLDRLGLRLPDAPSPVASYVPVSTVHAGSLALVSGQIPIRGGELMATGRVPDEVSIDQAQACARQCVINALACLRDELGGLDRVRRVVKLDGFVASPPGFGDHPRVINGASDLLIELMGEEAGRHARAAVGAPSLPLNVPVEIAFTFLVD